MASGVSFASLGTARQASSILLGLSLLGLLLASSQSGASWAAYALGVLVLARLPALRPALAMPAAWAAGALMLWLLVSHLWSPTVEVSAMTSTLVRVLLQACLLLAVAEQVKLRQDPALLVHLLILATTGAALAAIWAWWGSPMDVAGVRLHGLGQLENPNVLGLVCGAAVVLAVHQLALRPNPGPWQLAVLLCLPVLLAAVALSESRNAWFSTSAGILVVVVLHPRFRSGPITPRIQALVGIVAGGTIGAALAIEPVRNLLFPRGASIRPDIWQEALDRVLDGHLLVGLGNGAEHIGTIANEAFQHTHNLFLSALFHGGLVALVLLFALLASSVQVLLRHKDNTTARLALALLGTGVAAALVDQYPLLDKVNPGWLLLWAPVGIAMGLHWQQRQPGSA